jgi:hypothetical protein
MGCKRCAERRERERKARQAAAKAAQRARNARHTAAKAAAARKQQEATKALELQTAWHVWGWKFIHRFSTAIPPETLDSTRLNHVRRIVQLFIETLPCKDCGGHATQFLASGPAPRLGRVQTGYALVLLLHELHNDVNARTGKPTAPLTVLEEYKPVNLRIAFREYSAAVKREPNPPVLALQTIDTHLKGLGL